MQTMGIIFYLTVDASIGQTIHTVIQNTPQYFHKLYISARQGVALMDFENTNRL